ncbi:MAG: hypothetical protein OET63_12235 [Desulfobacterales bacterium]|nr:hypothetical protein [Desulfobacterales bacterium]
MVIAEYHLNKAGKTYTTDEDIFAPLDKNLGANLKWNTDPGIDGGTLH